jgi:hypothetical protein
MHTDKRKASFLSVCIRVHPWPKWFLTALRGDADKNSIKLKAKAEFREVAEATKWQGEIRTPDVARNLRG